MPIENDLLLTKEVLTKIGELVSGIAEVQLNALKSLGEVVGQIARSTDERVEKMNRRLTSLEAQLERHLREHS